MTEELGVVTRVADPDEDPFGASAGLDDGEGEALGFNDRILLQQDPKTGDYRSAGGTGAAVHSVHRMQPQEWIDMVNDMDSDSIAESVTLDAKLDDLQKQIAVSDAEGRTGEALFLREMLLDVLQEFLSVDIDTLSRECFTYCLLANVHSKALLEANEPKASIGLLRKVLFYTKREPCLFIHDDLRCYCRSITLNNLACVHKRANKAHTALHFVSRALSIDVRRGFLENSVSTKLNLATVLSMLNRHPESVRVLYDCIRVLKCVDDLRKRDVDEFGKPILEPPQEHLRLASDASQISSMASGGGGEGDASGLLGVGESSDAHRDDQFTTATSNSRVPQDGGAPQQDDDAVALGSGQGSQAGIAEPQTDDAEASEQPVDENIDAVSSLAMETAATGNTSDGGGGEATSREEATAEITGPHAVPAAAARAPSRGGGAHGRPPLPQQSRKFPHSPPRHPPHDPQQRQCREQQPRQQEQQRMPFSEPPAIPPPATVKNAREHRRRHQRNRQPHMPTSSRSSAGSHYRRAARDHQHHVHPRHQQSHRRHRQRGAEQQQYQRRYKQPRGGRQYRKPGGSGVGGGPSDLQQQNQRPRFHGPPTQAQPQSRPQISAGTDNVNMRGAMMGESRNGNHPAYRHYASGSTGLGAGAATGALDGVDDEVRRCHGKGLSELTRPDIDNTVLRASALFNLGVEFEHLGMWDRALAAYAKAEEIAQLRLDPENPAAGPIRENVANAWDRYERLVAEQERRRQEQLERETRFRQGPPSARAGGEEEQEQEAEPEEEDPEEKARREKAESEAAARAAAQEQERKRETEQLKEWSITQHVSQSSGDEYDDQPEAAAAAAAMANTAGNDVASQDAHPSIATGHLSSSCRGGPPAEAAKPHPKEDAARAPSTTEHVEGLMKENCNTKTGTSHQNASKQHNKKILSTDTPTVASTEHEITDKRGAKHPAPPTRSGKPSASVSEGSVASRRRHVAPTAE